MQVQYNNAIVTTLLDEFGYPHKVDGLISLIREQNLAAVDATFFTSLPAAIQDYCGTYFWIAYGSVWMAFFPFFLITLIEFGIHFIYSRFFKKSKVIAYTSSKEETRKAA